MALDYDRRGKDGSSNWAQHYLIDPLHEVEAWQTAQTGGQYNNKLPTQHTHVSNSEYYEQPVAKSGGGLGRSISLRIGSSKSKEKERDRARDTDENEGNGIRRKTSMRNRLIRRFTDESKDQRYTTLRPLNEVPDKEISNRENADVARTPRSEARKVVDGANIENMPMKKENQPASNNPFRDSMSVTKDENLTPPSSPPRPQSRQVAPNNPFRDSMQGAEYLTPPSSPKQPHSRSTEHRALPKNMQRNNGPRSPHRPPSTTGNRSVNRPASAGQGARRPPSRNNQKPSAVRGVAADTIDILDTSFYGMTFHHEGPYDATLAHKNRNPKKSPVEATKVGNSMAIKATAKADLENSLVKGRPLDGVAAFPPGSVAPGGEVMNYEEYDVMVLDGKFRRWPNEKYRDEDIKGKGVEGYDGDLRAKQEKEHRRGKSLDMDDNSKQSTGERSGKLGETNTTVTFVDDGNGLKRGGSTSGRLEGAAAKIKRTFSLKRREKRDASS